MSGLYDFYEFFLGIKNDLDIVAPNTGLAYVDLDAIVWLNSADNDWWRFLFLLIMVLFL